MQYLKFVFDSQECQLLKKSCVSYGKNCNLCKTVLKMNPVVLFLLLVTRGSILHIFSCVFGCMQFQSAFACFTLCR